MTHHIDYQTHIGQGINYWGRNTHSILILLLLSVNKKYHKVFTWLVIPWISSDFTLTFKVSCDSKLFQPSSINDSPKLNISFFIQNTPDHLRALYAELRWITLVHPCYRGCWHEFCRDFNYAKFIYLHRSEVYNNYAPSSLTEACWIVHKYMSNILYCCQLSSGMFLTRSGWSFVKTN
jgi:hypothetical protein